MLKVLRKSGFASIVEVIVTAIIFSLAAFGVLTSISMLQPHSGESSARLEAAYAGKKVIDDLRSHVMASTWDLSNSLLAVGVNQWQEVGDYNVIYWAEDVTGLNVRKLRAIVAY